MAKGQTWISTTGEMEGPLAEAMKTFETDKESLAFTLAIRDWYNNRRANSKRESLGRLEQSMTQILAIISQLDARMCAVEKTLRDMSKFYEGD